MSKLKTVRYGFKDGKATYVYRYKHNEFLGEAICHEDDKDFERKIKLILNGKLPNLTDEGYKVAKERDIKKIGYKLKKVYEYVLENPSFLDNLESLNFKDEVDLILYLED